jgi:hypothetical protein
MRSFVPAVLIAVLPTVAYARWSQNGQPTPDVTNRKATDGFSAQLLVISHLPEFIKEWTTSPPEHVPHVPAVSKAKRGEALAITLFFVGCKVDTSGRCTRPTLRTFSLERPFRRSSLTRPSPPGRIASGPSYATRIATSCFSSKQLWTLGNALPNAA